jgi:hypothetical protein
VPVRPRAPVVPAPRVAPQPPKGTRPVYAHVERISLACPACGRLSDPRMKRAEGYDKTTGFFACRGCGYGAYVGVVLWPARRSFIARPGDHVLSPGQAVQLRQALSYAEEEHQPRDHRPKGIGAARTRLVNRVCTCGQPCNVHGGALAGIALEETAGDDVPR